MADQSPSEFQGSKNHLQAPEAKKSKKSSKKKPSEKTSGAYADPVEPHTKGVLTEANFDLLHYTNKLEYELATAKKQLKSQRKKFRQIIHGLAQHFDSKGVTAQALDEYIRSLEPVHTRNEEMDSYYEKLFTVNKYQIVEDPITHQIQQIPVEHHVENGGKLSVNHMDVIPKLNVKAAGKYSQEEGEKDDKKKGRKSSKTTTAETNGDDAPKKRKYTKKPKTNEEEQKNQAPELEEIQEIPPFIAKDQQKKSEGKASKSEEVQKDYGDLAMASKMYGADSGLMGLGGYGMNGLMQSLAPQVPFDQNALMSQYFSSPMHFGAPMSDGGDSYNKLIQELLKSSMNPSMMNMAPDKTKEMMNFLQQAGYK